MRFSSQMKDIAFKLETQKGYCVLQPVYCDGGDIGEAQLKNLEAAHFKKIDISDGIYVVNIGGYTGKSVSEEINYAKQRNKEIIYHE